LICVLACCSAAPYCSCWLLWPPPSVLKICARERSRSGVCTESGGVRRNVHPATFPCTRSAASSSPGLEASNRWSNLVVPTFLRSLTATLLYTIRLCFCNVFIHFQHCMSLSVHMEKLCCPLHGKPTHHKGRPIASGTHLTQNFVGEACLVAEEEIVQW